METVVKSDVFFFITTMCVILVTIIVVVLGAYFIRIVSDVKYITKRAKKETDEIADEVYEDEYEKAGLNNLGRSSITGY